jgi:HPt (histidine-containing phosphotransfer) domain-containing protein
LREIIARYLEDAPRLLREMQQAAQQGDVVWFTRAAHSLKSSSAQVGANTLAARCKDLEQMGQTGTLEGWDEQFARVEACYEPVRGVLETMVAEAP